MPVKLPGADCSLLLSVKLNQTPVAARHHEEVQSRLHIPVAHALQLGDCSVGEIAEEACCHQAKLDTSQVTTEAGWVRHLVNILMTATRQRWEDVSLTSRATAKRQGAIPHLLRCVLPSVGVEPVRVREGILISVETVRLGCYSPIVNFG